MSTNKTVTPSNLLFFAARKLRDAALEYANTDSTDDDDEIDALHQAALDYAEVANAINAHSHAIACVTTDATTARILATSETTE